MSRAQPMVDHIVTQRFRDAALDCFEARGYHGTSVRSVAAAAGLSVRAVYDLFGSKQAILLEIIDATYSAAVAQLEAAVVAAGDEPARRLEAAIRAQCEFYTRSQRAARVAERELCNLDPEQRERMRSKRARLSEVMSEIIDDGAARGAFEVADPEAMSRALLTMCVAIGSWYDPRGSDAPRQIAQSYCEIAERMAGVRFRTARSGRRLTAVPLVPQTA